MSEELHGVEKRAEAAEARLAEVENGRAAGWSQLFDKLEKLGRLTGERSVIVETLAALDALAEATSPVAASERAAGQKAVERYRAQIRYANAPSWTDEEVLAENAMGAASRALDTAIVALERAYAESGNGATKASATADDSGCKEP
jgi:VIT1/CCC1 family predicted Fe2+/Mn2+ transporter